MRPAVVAVTNAGSSAAIPLNTNTSPFNVGLGVVLSGGTPNFTVQHTFDDVFNSAVTPTWFNHPTLNSLAASTDGNYAFPVRAIRVTINSGTGTATLTAIQAGLV